MTTIRMLRCLANLPILTALLLLPMLHAFSPPLAGGGKTLVASTWKDRFLTGTVNTCRSQRGTLIWLGWNDNDDDDGWGSSSSSSMDDDGWGSGPPTRHQQRFRNIRPSSSNNRRYGAGHDYERDPSDSSNNDSIDIAAVDRLLSARLSAKKRRDFDTADAIRDQLQQEYSVSVYDREKMWTTARNRGRYGQQQQQHRHRGGAGRFGPGPQGGGRWRPQDRNGGRFGGPRRTDFGPLGHDYRMCPDAGMPNSPSLDEDTIHSYLAQRLQAKLARNYPEADRILQDLWQAGVRVHDGRKEWRADGIGFGPERGDGRPGRTSNTVRRTDPYTQSPQSEDCGDSVDEIQDLVDRRLEAKTRRDFPEADALRDQLRISFNVLVNDRLRQWSIGNHFGNDDNDGFGGAPQEFTMSSLSVEPVDEAQAMAIQEKVNQRLEARKVRDYDTADAIRDELMETYNVVIQDKLGQWSIGGEFEGFGRKPRDTSLTRRGGGSITPEVEAIVVELIGQRVAAKSDRDYDTADTIRDRLFQEFSVKVDDKAREWMVVTEDYAFDGDETKVDPDTLALIQGRLRERFHHKNNREYELADAIRDELQETYDVSINDRICEWTMGGASGGGRSRGVSAYDNAPTTRNGYEQRYSGGVSSSPMEFTYREIDDDGDDTDNGTSTPVATETAESSEDDFFASMSALLEDDLVDDVSAVSSMDTAKEEDDGIANDNSSTSSPATNSNEEANVEDLTSLTVPKLKALLKEAGLPVSGRKAELVERLLSR